MADVKVIIHGHELEVPEHLVQPEPVAVDVVGDLVKALERMVTMHNLMMEKTNIGMSFYDAHCISEMVNAPLQAAKALNQATACSKPPNEFGNNPGRVAQLNARIKELETGVKL